MEDDADVDEDVARVLEGTGGDPEKIRDNMRLALQNKELYVSKEGVEELPKIAFRQINPMALWLWFEFYDLPSSRERELLESCIKAWFMIGKLGGFNAQNLQVHTNASDDLGFFEYDTEELEESMGSYIHDVGEVEYRKSWARVRVDMGTADELALDVLLNMMIGYSKDWSGIKKIYLGGSNKSWPVPKETYEDEQDFERGGKRADIDPMTLPEGMDEIEMLDELGLGDSQDEKRQKQLLSSKRMGKGGPAAGTLEAAVADLQKERREAAARQGSSEQQEAPWGASLTRRAKKMPEGMSVMSKEEFEREFPNRE
jgi:hypothetical protein